MQLCTFALAAVVRLQLSVQQLQRALTRLRDENESLTRLVTGLHEQQSQAALHLAQQLTTQ
jgi:cell division protein FtsB